MVNGAREAIVNAHHPGHRPANQLRHCQPDVRQPPDGHAVGRSGVLPPLPIVTTFIETGLVPRDPRLLAFLSLACGLILDTVTRGRRELKRLHNLSLSK
jgi:hypothetical protein